MAFKAAIAQALKAQAWPWLESGRIKPVIHRVFAATDAAQAHALMESNQHIGKLPVLGPFFSGPPMGIGILTAGIILAIMVIPFIASVMRDVFELVPKNKGVNDPLTIPVQHRFIRGADEEGHVRRFILRLGNGGIALGTLFFSVPVRGN